MNIPKLIIPEINKDNYSITFNNCVIELTNNNNTYIARMIKEFTLYGFILKKIMK